MGTKNDPTTGRAMTDGDEAVETLTDLELDAELTIAATGDDADLEREDRFDALLAEQQRRVDDDA